MYYARPALLVVVLLSVGRLAHQQSVISDDYVPAKTDVTKLHVTMNDIKRHVGKFLRIGRSWSGDRWTLRSDDGDAPVVPRLSERVVGPRRQRSDWHDTGDTLTPYDIRSQNAGTSGLLRDTVADSSAVNERSAKSRKKSRSGGVRFVRIGKADRQLGMNRKRSDDKNVFRRSLENRFVRIGK